MVDISSETCIMHHQKMNFKNIVWFIKAIYYYYYYYYYYYFYYCVDCIFDSNFIFVYLQMNIMSAPLKW